MSTPFDTVAPAAATVVPATEKQLDFLRSLMVSKAALMGLDSTEAAAKLDAWLPTLSKAAAHTQIDKTLDVLKGLRVSSPVHAPAAPKVTVDVPEGRYALPTEDGATNATAFYKVGRPTTGRWAGYVFVKLLVGGDEQKLSQKHSMGVLGRIAAFGAEKSSALYGHEIGRCGICHTRLTNDDSRARGIGPKCSQAMGW